MRSKRLAASLAVTVLSLGTAATALAQPNRVFASARNGNDLNSCANINTPCQTLQGAVNQVAAGGSVLVLDTGGYGPVSIIKSVTIEAPAGVEAFIHPPSGAAVTIFASESDVVVLRGLTLSVGDIAGINYGIAGAVHVERCVIDGFPIGILATRWGGSPVYGDLYVEDTIIRGCSLEGIGVWSPTGLMRATIERCELSENGGTALNGYNNTRTVAWNTVAAGNGAGFLLATDTFHSAAMLLERCTASGNQGDGVYVDGNIFDSPATLWISNSTITGNKGAGFDQLNTSQFLSRTNNTVEANASNVIGSPGSYSPK